MRPLLSIVVPTKDRYKYLKHLINLIDSFKSTEIELVLQDNTEDNKEFVEYLNSKNYSFIRYDHRTEQIPIFLNSDLAILNSTGEYVCFIGDDDGVISHIVDCVKWMKENEVEVMVPSIISYHWPDFISSVTGNISGTLSYKPFTQTYKFKDPIESLNEIMDKGFLNRGELPLVYHGIVRRDTLDKIYQVGATYFPGPSPDIANGVALSLLVKTYVQLDFPVIISGASQLHGGGIRKMKNKVANINDIAALPPKAKENWEKNIPKVWTGETVWPESAIKALRYMGREDLIEKVNFEYMLAMFIVFHAPIAKLAIKLSKNKLQLFVYVLQGFVMRYYSAAKRIIMRKMFHKNDDGRNIAYDIQNIEQAASFLLELHPTFRLKN